MNLNLDQNVHRMSALPGDADTGRTKVASEAAFNAIGSVSELNDDANEGSPFDARARTIPDDYISDEDVNVKLKKVRHYVNTEIKRDASRSKSREPDNFDTAISAYDKKSSTVKSRKLSLDEERKKRWEHKRGSIEDPVAPSNTLQEQIKVSLSRVDPIIRNESIEAREPRIKLDKNETSFKRSPRDET